MATKTFKVALSLDNPRIIQSGIDVRSFDKESVKISISLTKDSQTYQVPIGATIRISLLKLARQEQKIIVDVPNTNRDSIDWIVPDYLDGYQGTVRVGVYLVSGAENVDLGYFTILSNVSDIDKMADEFTDNVLQGWEVIEAELQELNLNIAQTKLDLAADMAQVDSTIANINAKNTQVDTLHSDVTSKYNAFDASVTQANQTIDDILALQPQFQAVLDETTGKDVISAPEVILARGGAYATLGERLDVQFGDIINQKTMFGNGDITDFLTMDEQNIVLSGDSMSFNLQDWQLPSANNSADKNYPGLMSWAHVLRDTIIRNDAYFTNAKSVDYEVVSSFNDVIYGMSQEKYLMPFNNDNLSIRLKRDSVESSIKIKYKHNSPTNKAVLHLNKHRYLEACIFDIYVDDVLKVSNIDVYGNPDFYKGFEMLDVSIDFPGDNKERIISLKNFRIPEGVENTTNIFRVILNGLGTKKQNIALTGEGGVTSEWFLSNLQERVLKYNPRFVALVLGANDIYKNVDVETYKLNMKNIVNQIRGQYPQCQILLMSAPAMGHSNTPDSKTIEYNLALRRIAYDKQCYFVDLLELFKQMHTSYWRYDNVHLTKMGSGVLGKNIINLLMPENIVDAKWFDTTYYLPYKHVIKGAKLTLLNGWLNVEGYPPLQYTKNGKSVRIFGNIKNGVTTPTTELCLLPPSIRLSNLRIFGALNLNAADDVSTGALLLSSNGYLRTSYNIKNVNLSIDIQYELD